ncbi:MAG: hypothetical protein M3Y17_00480 [Actinomycetota bacterium]|nr:hypothetical protein [Actinomycetota bacterium]
MRGSRNNDLVSSTNPTGGASAWTHTPADINYPFVEPHTVGLYAVSCASSHLCVAVDTLGTAIVSTDPAAAVRHR